MLKQPISTDKAPKAIGPYSQAIQNGSTLYISGQIPVNPATGEIVAGNTVDQARQVFKNLQAILDAAGLSVNSVVKTTIFLKNLGDFAAVNEEYAKFFKEPYPARATIEVSNLPKGALIEIEAIASK